MGSGALIEALGRVKNSFNSYPLDAVAQRAALAAIGDEAYFRDICARVIRSRETLCVPQWSLWVSISFRRVPILSLICTRSAPPGSSFARLRERASSFVILAAADR
ncbi:MAG: hypothetical protein R3E50_04275 [Halioglobus sp.]